MSDFLTACWALRYLLAGICVVAYVVACIDAWAYDRRRRRAAAARALRAANTARLRQHTASAFDAAMTGDPFHADRAAIRSLPETEQR